MFRKTLLSLAAAAMMVLGTGLTSAPAEAGHRHIGIYIGTPYIGFHNYGGHRHGHCHVRKIKRHGHWVRVKSCHSHRHGHPHHY